MIEISCPQPMRGQEYEELCANGDRGFRFETYFTPGRGVAWPGSREDGLAALEERLNYYAPQRCRIAQVYFYLCEYNRRPLDETAFAQMTEYLQKLRTMGVRAVLRFAYEYEVGLLKKKGPTTGRIRQHCAQLGRWFRENDVLVRETVMVLQAGMVGAWGEWHNAQFPHSGKKVLSCLAEMAPPYMGLQVRTRPIKRKAGGLAAYSRIGYHDDYLVGVNYKWSAPRAKEGSREYRRFLEESARTLNDGEMPWGKDTTFAQGRIDGKQMIFCCRERCLSTLSLAHNYREDGGSFNMERWKQEWVTPEELRAMGCAFQPAYFQDAGGNAVQRSVYEYLRDHLGYQLGVEELSMEEVSSGRVRLRFALHNYGFALPHGFTELSVIVRAREGEAAYPVSQYRAQDLPCGAFQRYTAEVPAAPGSRVGLRLLNPRAPRLRARFASRLPLEEGMAVLGEVR